MSDAVCRLKPQKQARLVECHESLQQLGHDRTSAGSMSDFFRSGVIYAALKTSQTKPLARDLLNSSVRNGAMMSTTALSCSAVGRKSSAQLLSGNARTVAVTSSTVSG